MALACHANAHKLLACRPPSAPVVARIDQPNMNSQTEHPPKTTSSGNLKHLEQLVSSYRNSQSKSQQLKQLEQLDNRKQLKAS